MGGIAALFAIVPADKYGRKLVIFSSSIIFTFESIICAVSFSKWFLLIGRILLGVAIGFSSMTVPIYISESSPVHIRGILITSFHLLLTFGQMFANVMGGIFSYINPEYVRWM